MSRVILPCLAVCTFTVVMACKNTMAQSAFAGNRLFMAAEERVLIDAQLSSADNTAESGNESVVEKLEVIPDSTQQVPRYRSMVLNGLVVRPDANAAIVWINSKAQLQSVPVDPVSQQVRIRRLGNDYILSPGEKVRYQLPRVKSDG